MKTHLIEIYTFKKEKSFQLTFEKNFENGDEDPFRGDARDVGDPLFESDAKFLIMLKGDPDFLRFGDSTDLFKLCCGTGLNRFVVRFSFSTNCTSF